MILFDWSTEIFYGNSLIQWVETMCVGSGRGEDRTLLSPFYWGENQSWETDDVSEWLERYDEAN